MCPEGKKVQFLFFSGKKNEFKESEIETREGGSPPLGGRGNNKMEFFHYSGKV